MENTKTKSNEYVFFLVSIGIGIILYAIGPFLNVQCNIIPILLSIGFLFIFVPALSYLVMSRNLFIEIKDILVRCESCANNCKMNPNFYRIVGKAEFEEIRTRDKILLRAEQMLRKANENAEIWFITNGLNIPDANSSIIQYFESIKDTDKYRIISDSRNRLGVAYTLVVS